ncbi:MAG: hypothetical protein SCK70_06150 [bacterium]|nr:hypothetical protein [bacterium]
MAKLIIKRTSEWNNRMRDIGIYLDGEKISVIGNGQTKEFEIEPGEHRLKTKIDWCGSETLTFELTDNETQKIELSGFKLGKWLMPIALVISIVYFVFGEQLKFDPMIFLLLILPFGLYLIYHLTFGRNKYLMLREI